jgi:pyrophosphatase PpaX
MPWRCVLFDLDGTLVDSIDLIIQSAQAAFAGCGYAVPRREQILAGIGRTLPSQFRDFTSDEAEVARLIQAYRTFQLEHHDRLTSPYAGVNDVVHDLVAEGRILGVVTSKIEPLARRALSLIGLDGAFPLVVGLESTTRHKPDPAPLLHATQRLGADPADTVYVGDSPFDLRAAHAAGMASIAVCWGAFRQADLERERPTHVAPTAADLGRLLRARSGIPTA